MEARAMMRHGILLSAWIAALCLSAWPALAATMPHGTLPAIAAPGGSIRVDAAATGQSVALAGPGSIALEAAWAGSAVDGFHARCTVPADTPPGRYDLVVGEERRSGAVWILEAIPASYRLAFVSGSDPSHLAEAAAVAEAAEVLAMVFLVTVGDTGGDDSAAAYASAIEAAPFPVLMVSPGTRVDDPYPFASTIGEDTLLIHDPLVTALGAADGALHRLRRATRASRWSIAVWPHYDPFIGRRAQLILFADDPVDLFVAPIPKVPERIEDAPMPGFWPSVRFEPLTAGAADTLLVVQVTPAVLRPARIPIQQEVSRRPGRNRDRTSRNNNGN